MRVLAIILWLALASWSAATAQVGPLSGAGPAFIFTSTTPIGAPTSIGSNNPAVNSGTTFTMTTSANIVAGNLVVLGININFTSSGTISSVSDGTNTYTKAVQVAQTNTDSEIWYKANASAVSSGATITVTYSAGAGSGDGAFIGGVQITGIITASPLDQIASAHNTSVATLTATTPTLGQANEIAVGTSMIINAATYNGATAFTNSFNALLGGTNGRGVVDYDIVAATTAVSYSPTFASSQARMTAVVATFKGF